MTVVARREWHEDDKIKYSDTMIRCLDCSDETDLSIVLHSHNGERIKAGTVKCGKCKKVIKV